MAKGKKIYHKTSNLCFNAANLRDLALGSSMNSSINFFEILKHNFPYSKYPNKFLLYNLPFYSLIGTHFAEKYNF